MRAITIKTSSKGDKYALCRHRTAIANDDHTIRYEPSFAVYKLCSNYDGKVRGGIRQTWRYVAKDLTLEDAQKLFNRRAA